MTSTDASRPRPRAFWADARFFLGLLLIAASVAGVWFLVASSRQTEPAYAATRTIVPGEIVTSGDLRVVDVALGVSRDAYLAPEALTEGVVATRTIGEGELVPASSLGPAEASRTTTVVVRSSTDVPASVRPGTAVDIWVAPPDEQGRFGAPSILVAGAVVSSVSRDDSMIGGGASALELVIPRSDVADVLAAIADESSLSVVPAVGAAR